MFGGYHFGDISKSLYNAATGNSTTNTDNNTIVSSDSHAQEEETNPSNDEEKATDNGNNPAKQPRKRDRLKAFAQSTYQSTTSKYKDYKFGDISRGAYRSVTGQTVPREVNITNPIKEGFLHQKSSLLLTYRKVWAVLQDKFLYLFKGEKQYNQCVSAFDLTSYCEVGCALSSGGNAFHLNSANDNQRFLAASTRTNERDAWIQSITKVITGFQLDEMKAIVMAKVDTEDVMSVNPECIAYYIIDLEYAHQENGDPQTLLRNQNFIISAVIWSYIHEPDPQFNKDLVNDLSKEQQTALKYWQQPIAVGYGMMGALKHAVHAPVAGVQVAGYGAYFASRGGGGVVIYPLALIAGATIGTAYYAPAFAKKGFARNYNKAKQ